MQYISEQILRLTKRWNNSKRSYLLVNPLQGKHIPASPAASWEMMHCLGAQVAERYPGTKLVIGFAETATALAAVVAGCFGGDCVYIHTTREEIPGVGRWLMFQEEHSHAVEQKLCGDRLGEWLQDTPQLVIVDDELSTGKTMRNLTARLREQYPQMAGKPVAAASLINRLSPEHTALFQAAGIQSEFLLRPPEEDYTRAVAGYDISPAVDLRDSGGGTASVEPLQVDASLPNPRTGVQIGRYQSACQDLAARLLSVLRGQLPEQGRVLVLGTEECMYPALVLGRALEAQGAAVSWHATTRSPIGICTQPGYPVTSGYQIHSFYEDGRATYLYNMQRYDLTVVLSDSAHPAGPALRDVAEAVRRHGCSRLLYVQGGSHVQLL